MIQYTVPPHHRPATAIASIDRIRKLIGVNLVLGIVTVVVALLH